MTSVLRIGIMSALGISLVLRRDTISAVEGYHCCCGGISLALQRDAISITDCVQSR